MRLLNGRRQRGLTSALICGLAVLAVSWSAGAQGNGTYDGVVKTEWLRDGRRMRLLDDFTYVDATGKRWRAKKNAVIDGASIPQVFWGAGGPYEGTYRDASVVHDYFCDETPKRSTWQAVHRMFYTAMLASGVDRKRALVMFGAVYRFGPRWPDPSEPPVCVTRDGRTFCSRSEPPAPPVPTAEDVRRLEELVDAGIVTTPEQIEQMPGP